MEKRKNKFTNINILKCPAITFGATTLLTRVRSFFRLGPDFEQFHTVMLEKTEAASRGETKGEIKHRKTIDQSL